MTNNKLLIVGLVFVFLSKFHSCYSDEWKRVYLASYPTSGNHWIRFLVEEASHIATSSVYSDPAPPQFEDSPHMKKSFPWGGFCPNHGYDGTCRYPTKDDRILLKTHYPFPRKLNNNDHRSNVKIIRIVRNPVDSIYAIYAKNPMGELKNKIPTERVVKEIKKWREFQTYWNRVKNAVTIRYEDIMENPHAELKKILKILQYKVTDEDIERAVAKYPPMGFMFKHIDKFSRKNLELIYSELSPLIDEFNYPQLN